MGHDIRIMNSTQRKENITELLALPSQQPDTELQLEDLDTLAEIGEKALEDDFGSPEAAKEYLAQAKARFCLRLSMEISSEQ